MNRPSTEPTIWIDDLDSQINLSDINKSVRDGLLYAIADDEAGGHVAYILIDPNSGVGPYQDAWDSLVAISRRVIEWQDR